MPQPKENARAASRQAPPRGPEFKIGPFAAGIGVAVWLNAIQTDDGPRKYRSITIDRRRYFDRKTDEWKNSGSFNPGDIPALIFALEKAQEYIFTTPIPGQDESEPADRRDLPF